MAAGCSNQVVIREEIGGVREREQDWQRCVLTERGSRCCNCGVGPEARLRVRMVIPIEAGGQFVIDNGVVLCRACDMARAAWRGRREVPGVKRPLTCCLSRELYDQVLTRVVGEGGFSSLTALVGYLVRQFVTDSQRYEDVTSYPDKGQDVKIAVWVEANDYEAFKRVCAGRLMTVTACIKGLLGVCVAECTR